MKKIFGAKQKTPLSFCDGPQMTVSEFFFGDCPNYPKYHTAYRPVGQIHRVAAEGDAARMEILITLGQCSVFDRDRKNRTALHFACVYGRLPVVTVLVNNNCEIDAFDKNHTTPLMKSVQCWKQKCAAVLLEHGANPNLKDSSGNSALHYAVYNGHEEMAALLLGYNADIEQKTKDGFTPLLLALREKRVEVAEFLVKSGANIHVVDDLKRNTLIYAIRCGSRDMATLLLKEGIDFFYKDVFEWTALRYAIEGHCTFREILLDFEEKIHNNKKDNKPEQMDSGDDSSARVSSYPSPGTSSPATKEDEYICDSKQSALESTPPNCASNSSVATDKILENTGKSTVEVWVEEDLSLKSATEVKEPILNEAVEGIELLPPMPEPELELMSVEEDMSDDTENNQPLSILEPLPQINVGHLSGTGYQAGKINISGHMKESYEEHAQLMTPIETKDPEGAWSVKKVPAFKSEPDFEVTSEEDPNRFDDRRNIQSLRIHEDLPKTSDNVTVTADTRRGRNNNGQVTESAKEYPPLMSTDGMNDYVPDKAVALKESEGSAVKLTSEEEPNTQDGFEKNPLLNVLKKIQTEDAGYLSMAKDRSGGKTVMCQEKESPQDYPQSKPTVEENDSVSNEVPDAKHGKWCQEGELCNTTFYKPNYPKEYVQLKLPLQGRDSLPSEASETKQVQSWCAESSIKMVSEEDKKHHDDPEKNQRMVMFKRPQPKDIAYLSMASDEHKENNTEEQEEDSPEPDLQQKSLQPTAEKDSASDEVSSLKLPTSSLTAEATMKVVPEVEQEWCGGRGSQRQQPQPKNTAHLSMSKDERGVNVVTGQEKVFPTEYPELEAAIEKQEFVLTGDSIMKQEKLFTAGATTVQLRSEEEQTGWCGGDRKQRKPIFERLQLKWNARVSVDPERCAENTTAEERGATTVQVRPEEEQTGWSGSDKKLRKPIFERFQPKWSSQVPVDPERSGESPGATEERGATTLQLRLEEEQTGWSGRDKKLRKPIFERFQPKRSSRVSMDPEESGENPGTTEERGATAVQLRREEEQTGWSGSDKKLWKWLQPKWSARVSVDPEESREHTGGHEEKDSTVLFKSEEQTECHGSKKKPRLHILERLQPRWSVRVCVEAKQRGEKTEAAQMTHSPEKYPELKTTAEKQDSISSEEDSTMKHETSFLPEAELPVKSKEKQRSYSCETIQSLHTFQHLQLNDISHLSMAVGQRMKSIVNEEEGDPDLEVASGEDQNRCYGGESNQSLVEVKTKYTSNRINREKYPYGAVVAAASAATAAANAAAATTAAATTAAATTVAAAASVAATAVDELVLRRKSIETNNQNFLIKENSEHNGPRKKTFKEKHKARKEVRAMVDITQSAEPVSEEESGSSLKVQDSLNPCNALIDLKKTKKLLREKNKKMEDENTALRKKISEVREESSKLEGELVERDDEFWSLWFTLLKELKETRKIHCFYDNIKKHLSETEKQCNEKPAVTELAAHPRARDPQPKNARDALKELQESQDQRTEAVKTVQKMKDHLQKMEDENSQLKGKVKEQAEKIEELRRCLQNSCEKLVHNAKRTEARAQETLEELCKNNISPVNQTRVRIQSLQSKPSKMKTIQNSSTSAQERYEQQCIEELRISNALLYERYMKRRLNESCTQVHIVVEQDTSPPNTSETKFALESPCVASTCPCRCFFPKEALALPGNPRSSSDCMRSYPRMTEEEEESIKEPVELKQSLEYNLYQQKKKNNEIEKEIIGTKKLLKMTKIGCEFGECSSSGDSKTGHF